MDRHKCRFCSRNFNNGKALGAHMRSHMIKLGAQKGYVSHENDDFCAPKNVSNQDREALNAAKSASDKQKEVLYAATSASNQEKEVLYAAKSASNQALNAAKSTSGKQKEVLYAAKSVSDKQKEVLHAAKSASNQALNAVKSASDKHKEALFAPKSALDQALYEAKSASNQEPELEKVPSYSSTTKEELEKYPKTEHSSCVLHDDGSETEPSSKPTPFAKVFKRARNSRNPKTKTDEHSSPPSSNSELTPEENGAYILMMLSRDSWNRAPRKPLDIQDSNVVKAVKKSKVKGKYKCDNCDMSFKSYQALGGHNASHAAAATMAEMAAMGRSGTATAADEKIFQCPYCERVFASGQALGGHKRSHFSYGVFKPGTSSRIGEKLGFKFGGQLSAYDDDDQIIESETSAASGAEN